MEQFGYVRQGAEWVHPAPKWLKPIVLGMGVLVLALAAYLALQEDQGAKFIMVGICGLIGIFLILTALRGRQTIDLNQRAFVWQSAFGRQVLPFQDVEQLQPIHHTVNGAYQGIHYEAIPVGAAHKPNAGRRISPSFPTEAEAREYERAVRALMQR